jgi:hypothetical protein
MKKTTEHNHVAAAVGGALAEQIQEGEIFKAVDLSKYKFKVDESGDGKPLYMNISDLVDEIKALERLADQHKRQSGDLAGHMFSMASICKTAEEFDAVCERIVEVNRWGRPPKGTPAEQRHMWDTMPAAFRVYRSTIYTAWKKFDIYPNKKIKAQVPGPNGKPVQGEITIGSFVALRNMATRQRAAPVKPTPNNEPGVHVTADGTQIAVEAAKAGEALDPQAMELFTKLAQLYVEANHGVKEDILSGMSALVMDAEATMEIAKLVEEEAVAYQAARSSSI